MVKVSACPACGAPVLPGTERCPYCQQYLLWDEKPAAAPPMGGAATVRGLLFERRAEPRESAFTLAVPKGWLLEGGIQRADLRYQAVDVQTMEPKLDLTVKRDPVGTVALRWCPEIKYCDPRFMAAAMFFPPGSNYQGMLVWPQPGAAEFLVHVVFPWAHPQAQQARVVEGGPRPELVERLRSQLARGGPLLPYGYEGAAVLFAYVENGIHYLEGATVVLESTGQLGAGMWSNKETVLWRAPEDEFAAWEPIFEHIQASVVINPRWAAEEQAVEQQLLGIFNQAQQAERERARRRLEFQHSMQEMAQDMVEHRRQTHAEIRNDAYLMMTNQEEYVNPYTHQVEIGSNQWQYRWVTADGNEYYTDHEGDDPNQLDGLNQATWERTPVRPRFPY